MYEEHWFISLFNNFVVVDNSKHLNDKQSDKFDPLVTKVIRNVVKTHQKQTWKKWVEKQITRGENNMLTTFDEIIEVTLHHEVICTRD